MKKYWWFLFAFLSMASYFSPAFAASYRYQVEPVGAHQYVIRLESDAPQPFSMMLEGMKQKAQEVCGGYYRILQIDPETTQRVHAVIVCQADTSGQQQYTAPRQQSEQMSSPRTRTQQQELYPSIDGTPSRQPRMSSQQDTEGMMRVTNRAERHSYRNRFGVGLWASIMNFGLGPSVEWYPLDRFGIMGTMGALFDYMSFSARGIFLLPSFFEMDDYAIYPYGGGGFTYIKNSDFSELDASGFEACAGALFPLDIIVDGLSFRGEFVYSHINEDDLSLDWNMFSVATGVTYFF